MYYNERGISLGAVDPPRAAAARQGGAGQGAARVRVARARLLQARVQPAAAPQGAAARPHRHQLRPAQAAAHARAHGRAPAPVRGARPPARLQQHPLPRQAEGGESPAEAGRVQEDGRVAHKEEKENGM